MNLGGTKRRRKHSKVSTDLGLKKPSSSLITPKNARALENLNAPVQKFKGTPNLR